MPERMIPVFDERPGRLGAPADRQPSPITAPSLEESRHEAREDLIATLGPAHGTYRVRIRRSPAARPLGHPRRR